MVDVIKFPGQESKTDTHLDLNKLTEMLFFLAELHQREQTRGHSMSRWSRETAYETVAGYPNEELYYYVNSGSTEGWQKRPAFYDAVYNELKSRGLIPSKDK